MKSLILFFSGLAVSIPGVVLMFWLILSKPEGFSLYEAYPGLTTCMQMLLLAGYSLLYWANVELWRKGR